MEQTHHIHIPEKKPRKFLPGAFVIDTWKNLEPYFLDLKDREIHSVAELEKWLHDRSELETIVQEEAGWRYIRMTCDTTSEKANKDYLSFIQELEPMMARIENDLNKKLLASPYLSQLSNPQYQVFLRDLRKKVEIYRDENVPLFTEIQEQSQQYAVIVGAMTIEVNGKELTLQQASNYLKDPDRSVRESVFNKINFRRLEDSKRLDELFSKLVRLRHQVALNAGFSNFRDYMFAAMGRFDYTPKDCMDFHQSISKSIVPIVERLDRERRSALKLDTLKPWDRDVDLSGKPALKPFQSGVELINKTIDCFGVIHPFLGEAIQILKAMKHVDLESRKGKAPGGYNYPLYESGVPFIFMNSANSLNDLVTMVHEGGHAVHSLLVKDLEYVGFKSTPSEVAELASMSMELITLEHWDLFFQEPSELKRGRLQHLESILRVLPWVAAIDKFQHWIYLNPEHTAEQRKQEWRKIYRDFSGDVVDWTGQEEIYDHVWQKQLHLYEVPFYYIEYGMAQLGAIAIWRNYKKEPVRALEQYMDALKLGYTKTIGEIYATAGVRFDFSEEYVRELADFVSAQIRHYEEGK